MSKTCVGTQDSVWRWRFDPISDMYLYIPSGYLTVCHGIDGP